MAITLIFKIFMLIKFIFIKSSTINDGKRQLQIIYTESNLNYIYSETQSSDLKSQLFYFSKFTYLKNYNKLTFSTLTSLGAFKLASFDITTNTIEAGYILVPTTITTDTSNFLSIDYVYIDDDKFLLLYFFTSGNDYSYKSTFVEYSGNSIVASPSYSSLNDKFVTSNNQYAALLSLLGQALAINSIQYKLIHSLYSCIGNNKVIYLLFKSNFK